MRWKSEIKLLRSKKKNEKHFLFVEKIDFENFVSDFFENITKSY